MNSQQRSDYLLYTAVQEQNLEQLQQLWAQHEPQSFQHEILLRAIEGRNDDIFHFVADRLEQKYINLAIVHALNCLDRFEYLLPRVDLKSNNSLVLSWAAQSGDMDMVVRLMPLCDPMDPQCTALYEALFEENMDIAQVLYPVCNIEATMQQLLDSEYDCCSQIEWLEDKINETQNAKLWRAIDWWGTTRRRKL